MEAGDWHGGLREMPDVPPMEFPVWLATRRQLHTSRRGRIVFDFLVVELGWSERYGTAENSYLFDSDQ